MVSYPIECYPPFEQQGPEVHVAWQWAGDVVVRMRTVMPPPPPPPPHGACVTYVTF